jgi:hypothetical protein
MLMSQRLPLKAAARTSHMWRFALEGMACDGQSVIR